MNNKKFKVSICIPTYNNYKFLKKQIIIFKNSLKKIKDPYFFELCISDNHSSDKTTFISRKYKDYKIKIYRNKKNLGITPNLLNCIKKSNGQYTFLLGDDDLPDDKFYEELYEILSKNDLNKMLFWRIDDILYLKSKIKYKLFSFIVMRGATIPGILFKKKNIRLDYIKSNSLYPTILLSANYYLKHGIELINTKSKINVGNDQAIIDKFFDKMSRPVDYGVLERLKILYNYFCRNKINQIEYILSVYNLASWAFSIENNLLAIKAYEIINKYRKSILSYSKMFNFFYISRILKKIIYI
jgi:glycosyltransferase involved in cell wall biosynthesis